ncbi:MAG: metal ABC transporter substrate-binding protein [Candidatus Hecatellaceae archaeon]
MTEKTLAIIFSLILAASALTFIPEAKPVNQSNKLIAAVSIPPLAEWVEKVGGKRVQVLILIPEGADPHLYEPPPSLIAQASRAKLIVLIGLGFEPWAERIAQLNPEAKILRVSSLVKPRKLGSKPDPHVWLTPKAAMATVKRIAEILAELDPDHAEAYRERMEAYLAELQALDLEISSRLSAFKGKPILVLHPAWGYFAETYGLKQLALGEEASPARLAYIIEEARKLGLKTVFVEPFANPELAQTLAREIGGNTAWLNPLPRSYVEGLREAALTIAEALGGA